jgi:hypothetical protein
VGVRGVKGVIRAGEKVRKGGERSGLDEPDRKHYSFCKESKLLYLLVFCSIVVAVSNT